MKLSIPLTYLALANLVLLAGPAFGDTCITTTCHQALGKIPSPHQPVVDGDCSSCHVQKEKEHPRSAGKSFTPKAVGAALCRQCHDPKAAKKIVHPPVKEGDCLACHKAHGSQFPALLEVGVDQSSLCFGCHDNAMMKVKYLHGPAAVGECTRCHDPHSSNEKALQKGQVRDICLKCHADFGKALASQSFVHPPVATGACTACHNPHGSPVASILNKATPALCLDCHAHIAVKLEAKHPHKPLQQAGGCSTCHAAHYSNAKGLLSADEQTVCLGCHNTDKLGTPPLRNIQADLKGKKYLHGPLKQRKCTGCHDPHGSEFFRMLRGNYPAELYKPYKNGNYDGCLMCHEKNLVEAKETTSHTGFRNGSRNLHFVHASDPRKGRTCRLCHEPHASDGDKLINKEGTSFGAWKIPLNFKISATGGSCAPGCHRVFRYDREKPEMYKKPEPRVRKK